MSEKPLVSVIIPSYNHENYVEEAVRSVWNQTYRPIELIVVDDASQDRSVDLLRRLEKASPIPMQVHVHPENRGVPATLNDGIRMSRGSYLLFLASDDRLPPDRMMRHVGYLEDHPACDAVYGDLGILHEGTSGDPSVISYAPRNGSHPTLRGFLLWRERLSVQCMTFRRAVFQTHGLFFEGSRIEDVEFLSRLLLRRARLCYAQGVVIWYRELDTGLSRNCQENLENLRICMDQLSGQVRHPLLRRKVRSYLHFRFYMRYRTCGNPSRALRHLWRAFLLWPMETFYAYLLKDAYLRRFRA